MRALQMGQRRSQLEMRRKTLNCSRPVAPRQMRLNSLCTQCNSVLLHFRPGHALSLELELLLVAQHQALAVAHSVSCLLWRW